jgi:DNA-binding NtrC family response regulator
MTAKRANLKDLERRLYRIGKTTEESLDRLRRLNLGPLAGDFSDKVILAFEKAALGISGMLDRAARERRFTEEFGPSERYETIASVEQWAIIKALARCGNNRSRAAERLGISRRTLIRKIKLYGIS